MNRDATMEADLRTADAPAQSAPVSGQKHLPAINGFCVGCGRCAAVCPVSALEIVWDAAVLTQPDRCTSCGLCIDPCGDDAIHMQWTDFRGRGDTGEWRFSSAQQTRDAGGLFAWLRGRRP
ncbi:MAG: 4Fe-4S binding protein [Verrucomicrobiales bacterium]|nr:4Fe-4S binding protein [Verrucomicrobiales bacterium]